jgi:DNA repair protein RadC
METPREFRPIAPSKRRKTVGQVAPWVRIVREGGDKAPISTDTIRSPRDIWQLLAPTMEREEQEVFVVLMLNAMHRVVGRVEITRGTLDATLVHPREVFRAAIALNASAVVVAHNHPSGDPTPSAADRAITLQLVAAGRLLDIPVADHIIVGAGRYVSFSEAGLL